MTLGSHQTTVGKSQVHITPKWIIDALGPFDLDPCAADPRPWDCAKQNIALPQNGLLRAWLAHEFVWLNPPFERYGVARWIAKLAAHGNGIALLHARTETEWFKPCWASASAILFLSQRMIFHKPDGSQQTITNPDSKHYGKTANSGAPVVLVGFGSMARDRLDHFGYAGVLVTEWHMRKAKSMPSAGGLPVSEGSKVQA